MENLKSQAKDFAKQQGQSIVADLLNCFKKFASFSGRASRSEFWSFFVAYIVLLFVEATVLSIFDSVLADNNFCDFIRAVLIFGSLAIDFILLIPFVCVSVRRLHDLGLSGFWMWYLSSMGLPIIFVVNFLDLDDSCNNVLDRIAKVCNNWVAWLFLPFFWFFGAPTVMFLLFLYKGKQEENMFGPSPFANLQ